jgi:enterochelin esterase-like enzyme
MAAPTTPFAPFGLDGEPGDEAFWAAADALGGPPSVAGPDGGRRLLFLWRGSPATVCFESWSEPVELARWGGGDCWYAEVAVPARLRVTYWFRLPDGERAADPRNPAGAGPDRSIAATPDAEPQPHWPVVGPDEVLPLPRTRVRWSSARFAGKRTVRVRRPDGPGPHPTVLLLDGDDWLHLHPAVTAFDAATAAGEMPAATLVFLPTPSDREAELAGDPGLWTAVRDELVPLLAEHDVVVDQERLVVAGQSFGGLSALRAALDHPDLVTRVACQSGSFWWPAPSAGAWHDGPVGGPVAERLRAERPDLSGLRVAFDVGEHETLMLPHAEVVEELVGAAGATVRVSRATSGHDRAGWRHALVRDVAWALGAAGSES